MAMPILYLCKGFGAGTHHGKVSTWDGCIPAGCLYTCRMSVCLWMSVYPQDVRITIGCLYTCRMSVFLQDVGQWSQMGPRPNWANGPNGSRAQLGQWAQRAQAQLGQWDPTGPGPNWANGPNGSRAQLGQWAQMGVLPG